jgi:3-phenylpropionate/trans-cinnamate dioxygenase ferredoxin reductase subunit
MDTDSTASSAVSAHERIMIVGAGPAGLATACAYREHGGSAEGTLLGKENLILYQRPPLTKEFLRGELRAEKLPIEFEEWFAEHGIGLRPGCEAIAIDLDAVTMDVDGVTLHADRIVLATGSEPSRPALPGLEDPRVYTMRERPDSERIASTAAPGTRAVRNCSAGRRLRVEHWGDALGQGEIAGRVLAGQDAHWKDVPDFWSTIGRHTLKYAAWGDGHDSSRLEVGSGGAFTVWYSREGKLVGVLAHKCDEDYEHGRELIQAGESPP